MKENPFEKFNEPSDYLLPGELEQDFIDRIQGRIKLNKKVGSIIPLKWTIGIAASLLLVSIYFLNSSGPQESHQLAEHYFEPYKNYQIEQTRGSSSEATLSEAYIAYDDKDYLTAKALFEQKELNDPLDLFYFSVSLQGLQLWEEAMPLLAELEDKIPKDHKAAWQYHTGLNYLASGDLERAKNLFKALKEGESIYKEKSSKLLFEMGNQ